MGESRIENFYIWILSTIVLKIYALLLKDCFHCFTDENEAFFKR